MNNPVLWIALLIVMNFLWAASYSAVKLGVGSMDPLALVFWRFLAAFIIMSAWVGVRRHSIRMSRTNAIRLVGLGLLLGMSNFLWVTGINMSYATDAALLYVFEPVLGIVLAGLILKEKLRVSALAGLVLIIFGLGFLSGFDAKAFGFAAGSVAAGNLIIVVSFLFESFYSILLKPVTKSLSAPVITAVTLGVSVIVLSIPMGLRVGFAPPTDVKAIAAIAYLVIICTVIGYTLWAHSMKHVPVGVMLFTIFIQPISGPFIATTLLGESIDSRVMTGGIFLVSGMFAAIFGHLRNRQRSTVIASEDVIPAVGGV